MDDGQIGVIRTDRRKRQKNGSFKEFEDLREAGANVATRRQLGPGEQCSRSAHRELRT